MKKLFLFAGIFALMSPLTLKAQVTIGANQAPNPSAVLDLQSNGSLGLLLPCVVLTDTLAASPLAAHVPGMLVYNTTPSAGGQVVRGIYYDDGRRWWLATAGTGDDLGATYVGSPSILLNAASADGIHLMGDFERAALTGDVTAAQNSNELTIADGAVTSTKILDGSITGADIAPHSVSVANLNGDDGAAGQVPTVDADGDVTWHTPRWQVKYITTSPYDVKKEDENFVLINESTPVTYNFQPLTEADAGIMVIIYNNSGNSNTYNNLVNAPQINSSNGGIYLWSGKSWIAISKQ